MRLRTSSHGHVHPKLQWRVPREASVPAEAVLLRVIGTAAASSAAVQALNSWRSRKGGAIPGSLLSGVMETPAWCDRA